MQMVLVCVAMLAAGSPPIDFDTEIIPVLTRAGCNAGSCHGAAAGRGGFRLSLYGSDPTRDFETIVMELEGRRINLARPEASLLLRKPTCEIDHEGGYRLESDGPGATRLRDWIAQGARRRESRRLIHFEVSPAQCVVEQVGGEISLTATATFSDGATEQVTAWTVFTPEDAASVRFDQQASRATVLRRGRHLVVARYLDQVLPIELILPLNDRAVDLPGEPQASFIDQCIDRRLETMRLPVSPPIDDAGFLRRVRLDLTGRLPSPDERADFLQQTAGDRRARLIDRLMDSEDFTDYWTFRFARLLRIGAAGCDLQGAFRYHRWLRDRVADGTPFDRLANQLLTADGDSHVCGPANFSRTANGPREQAEFFSELFMGVRLRCANCHNHPLDHWTQDDYHGLAAIFAGIQRGRTVSFREGGQVTHPATGQAAIPRLPGERFLDDQGDARPLLAEWLTGKDNPYFARATVNRLWKAFFGRGLVEPADDLRATNPATHPELLEQLTHDFVTHGYDWRRTIRLICNSSTYGRSAVTVSGNAGDDRFYSRALTRTLEAEVLADALADVTGVADVYDDQPPGTRAINLVDVRLGEESLGILGRCTREQSCESSNAAGAGGLPRKLHLINGPLINRKVEHPEGRLHRLLADGRTAEEIVQEFYLRCLSREPTPREWDFWRAQWDTGNQAADLTRKLEDFVWALLTCREFITNH